MSDRSQDGPRVLLYSQDGLGLGHLRRASAIGGALVRATGTAAVLTILDSPLGPFFDLGPGQDCVKLPSIVKVSPGIWEPASLARTFVEVSALRRTLLCAVAESFQPDLLLVDHMPHGASGELRPMLQQLRSRTKPTKCVLGLRDIIDAPDVVRRVWTAENAYDALEQCYDAVLVYGRRDIFDPVDAYGFPAAVARRVHFMGYICTPGVGRYPARLRARFGRGSADHVLLVAMAGGGADAYPMMRGVLDAVPLLRRSRDLSAVLITGPFMPRSSRHDLERRAREVGARVRASVSDPLSYLEAADVIVARAGYSSSVEILRSGTPAVLLPRPGPSAEQRMRAARFTERGWVGSVDPDHLSGERIAAAVSERISRASTPAAPAPDGLERTVGQLVSMLDGRTSSAEVPVGRVPLGRPDQVPTP